MSSDKTFGEQLKSFGLKRVISYMDSDPDGNIPKILDWLERNDRYLAVTNQVQAIRSGIADKNGNWYRLVKSLWTDIDDGQRRHLFENVVVNASLISAERAK